MKARKWFESRGQSLRSQGFTWHEAKILTRLYTLPRWAQAAIARGHMLQREDSAQGAA